MLDYILNTANITAAGIACPDADTAYKLYKFLREAILDKHIPLRKPVGFRINSKYINNIYSGTVRLGHQLLLGESFPELAKNLLDKIVCTTTQQKDVVLELSVGENYLNKMTVKQFGMPLKFLYENPLVANFIGDEGVFSDTCYGMQLLLKTELVIGYRSFADNSKIIPKEYFPCASDASLAPFVRVLPMLYGGTIVPMRFYGGLTPEELKEFFRVWKREYEFNGISKEETEWLQSFSI